MSNEAADCYEFGPFYLNGVERCLFKSGEFVPLTSQTFDILKILLQHHGQVVTKNELMKDVWPDSFVEENNLTVRMSALRKVLCKDENGRHYVETVHGRGYRFVGKVRRAEPACEAGMNDELPNSLAVLPFNDEGMENELRHLPDVINGDIINRLSQLPRLKVIARSAVMPYKEQALSPLEVGQLLHVRLILVGIVMQLAERLIVLVELMDVRDGSQIWGALYSRQLSDIFGVEDEIANDITMNLQSKLMSSNHNFLTNVTRITPQLVKCA
jgi:DNA-binding winged helix-turn-helix (wHTH) protein